ncbi:carboxypeptidase M32 [Halococcoides cellulosivorans]|uniref:Metal-dependent carboxypeptidase n=1 Tax=Halococcoides cellulosivorans TaxID=1679096 RepID=A0A2R4X1G7_9EURY|nr:carboxypeptidase M32 [Halococcoides cellulosivorans]AWB27640.1 carboxypeptidase [Halococcoides cellulosivorans]
MSDLDADFRDHIERLSALNDATGVLSWDQQVTMPEGGTPARSAQKSALSTVTHDLLTDDRVADWIEEHESRDLERDDRAIVRELRRRHERAVRVPDELVTQISEASTEALPVWEQAREESDFDAFADALDELVALKRKYAEAIDPDRDPYAVLMEDFEPYLDVETTERILDRLTDRLPPLIEAIAASDVDPTDPFDESVPAADQEAGVRALLDGLGFDWDRGRLDTSTHPFTSGNQFDCRITTRFDPSDPLDGVGSTVHEFGHATYELGLPQDAYGTPLGESRDLVVHESQSRFWENHVGRTREFWEWARPILDEHWTATPDPAALYRAANQVEPGPIRVEADELTYHLHIAIRFEIERDLIRGDLAVDEVPQVWADKYDEYLGIRPADDAQGALQDIHWSHGNFGYFPTYSLGSVLAAQLDATVREAFDVPERVRAGEFDPIREWLGEQIHQHGQRYTTPALIEEATGEALTADPFLTYVDEKFGAIYR